MVTACLNYWYPLVYAEKFEWDDAKADANLRKHKVLFEHAAEACEDSFALIELDDSQDYGEDRFILIGRAAGGVLNVVYTRVTDANALSRLVRPTTMSGETIIARRRKSDGKLVRVFPDGPEEPFPDPGPATNLTEDEINAAALTDPDNPPRTPEREKHLKRLPQVKVMRRPSS